MGLAAIEVVDVHKRYRVYKERYRSLKETLFNRRLGEWEDHWVLNGLNLQVHRGTTFGLIGSNGAGKSTTLKLMSRILVPDRGTVSVKGRVSGLLELGAGFQAEYTGRENVYLNASLLGLSHSAIKARFDEIVAFAELEEYIDVPLRTYSSGMHMRLGFAVAIHVEPEILLVDEILAVGDEAFQHKCLDWLEQFQRAGGTIVMVSHNLGSIRHMCEEAAWLEDGRLRLVGPAEEVVDAYVNKVREDMERTERESTPASRPIPAVELQEARLLDRGRRQVDEVDHGSCLTVEVPYRVNSRVATPVFGIAIHRNDGVLVYATNTDIDGVELGPLECDAAIRLTYPVVWLMPGTYRVTVSVFPSARYDELPIDSHWQRYVFRVTDPERRDQPVEVSEPRDQGVARLPHRWEHAEARGLAADR